MKHCRTGIGHDIHRLLPGYALVLGGVTMLPIVSWEKLPLACSTSVLSPSLSPVARRLSFNAWRRTTRHH